MNIIDGKIVSKIIKEAVKSEVQDLEKKTGLTPGLAVIIVGDNPASKIYVNSKNRTATKLGIRSQVINLDKTIEKSLVIDQIKRLNEDKNTDAFLVQLPLPDHLNTWEILDYINPEKDADRIHPHNQGMVLLNRTDIYPCTPFGILKLLDHYEIDVTGLNAVVVGRSFIVGKPMAAMLTNRHATVTICHSKTKNIKDILNNADLIVAAIGKAGFVTPDMVKPGAILIDVGMNRITSEKECKKYCDETQQKKFAEKGYGLTGDIYIESFKKSSYYTPVPGGVGLMTVAMLMYNTLQLFKKRSNSA